MCRNIKLLCLLVICRGHCISDFTFYVVTHVTAIQSDVHRRVWDRTCRLDEQDPIDRSRLTDCSHDFGVWSAGDLVNCKSRCNSPSQRGHAWIVLFLNELKFSVQKNLCAHMTRSSDVCS